MWISPSPHSVSPVSALQTSHSLRSSTCDVSSNDYELQCELCCAAPVARSQEQELLVSGGGWRWRPVYCLG